MAGKAPMTYISGPITGTHDYLDRFGRAEVDLLARGEIPVNPAKVCDRLPKLLEWGEYMQVALAMLGLCERIYLLKGWQGSKGARIEVAYALEHGYEIEEER